MVRERRSLGLATVGRVAAVVKLYLEAVKTFGVAEGSKEEEWTEEDDREFLETMPEDAEAWEGGTEAEPEPSEGAEDD